MRLFRLMLLVAFCAALAPAAVRAEGVLLFNRSTLSILRQHPPVMPWATKDKPTQNPPLTFNVEVRDGMALYREQGWFNLSDQPDNSGVLMLFPQPVNVPILRMSLYAPFDILMINSEGSIVQIAPNIVLSDLQSEIAPPAPILAFLFLKGGLCAKLSINPGDNVQFSAFHRPPPVLTAPPPITGELPDALPQPAPTAPAQALPAPLLSAPAQPAAPATPSP